MTTQTTKLVRYSSVRAALALVAGLLSTASGCTAMPAEDPIDVGALEDRKGLPMTECRGLGCACSTSLYLAGAGCGECGTVALEHLSYADAWQPYVTHGQHARLSVADLVLDSAVVHQTEVNFRCDLDEVRNGVVVKGRPPVGWNVAASTWGGTAEAPAGTVEFDEGGRVRVTHGEVVLTRLLAIDDFDCIPDEAYVSLSAVANVVGGSDGDWVAFGLRPLGNAPARDWMRHDSCDVHWIQGLTRAGAEGLESLLDTSADGQCWVAPAYAERSSMSRSAPGSAISIADEGSRFHLGVFHVDGQADGFAPPAFRTGSHFAVYVKVGSVSDDAPIEVDLSKIDLEIFHKDGGLGAACATACEAWGGDDSYLEVASDEFDDHVTIVPDTTGDGANGVQGRFCEVGVSSGMGEDYDWLPIAANTWGVMVTPTRNDGTLHATVHWLREDGTLTKLHDFEAIRTAEDADPLRPITFFDMRRGVVPDDAVLFLLLRGEGAAYTIDGMWEPDTGPAVGPEEI